MSDSGCSLVPLGYRILVRPDADGLEETADGLHKHTSDDGSIELLIAGDQVRRDRLANIYGTVIAIGPLAFKESGGPEAWGVKVGDRVSFARHGGAFVDTPEGERIIVLNDEDLICLVA